MTQQELPGMKLKRVGKAKAREHHGPALELARQIARQLAIRYGTVSADQVQMYMEINRFGALNNAAGSIFDTGEFEPAGYRPSTRTSRHGGLLRVWRLKCPR